MADRTVSSIKLYWDSMSQEPDVREAAQLALEEKNAAEIERLVQRGPAPWPIRIILGAVMLFGIFQLLSLPVKAVSGVVAWWNPDIYITADTRAALTADEIAIMKKMPEELRSNVNYRDPADKADYVNAWQSARMQTCRNGSSEVTSGDYRGFKTCTSKEQAELQGWAFDQIVGKN